jgi:transposase
MPTKYDKDVKAKAIRLVRDHAGDYGTEWAAIREISSRLEMSAETLRKWLRRAEVDAGQAPGVPADAARGIRELKRKNAGWSGRSRFSGRLRVSSRGSATRYTADLRVHRREPGAVRGRTDLPCAWRAWHSDRPENLLGEPVRGAVQAGAVGRGGHRDPGRDLRAGPAGTAARRSRCTEA